MCPSLEKSISISNSTSLQASCCITYSDSPRLLSFSLIYRVLRRKKIHSWCTFVQFSEEKEKKNKESYSFTQNSFAFCVTMENYKRQGGERERTLENTKIKLCNLCFSLLIHTPFFSQLFERPFFHFFHCFHVNDSQIVTKQPNKKCDMI